MRIERYLYRSAARDGDKTAIVAGGMRISYARFLDLSSRFANSLSACGVRPGDRVLLLLDNSWQMAVAVFATWIAGAVVCPVNPSTKAEKLSRIVRNATPAAVIVEGRLAQLLASTSELDGVPRIMAQDFDASIEADPSPLPDLSDSELAALLYTSGSTGEPKGVMLTHANVDAAATAITSYLGNTASDVILGVLPMSFGYGLNQLITCILSGATLVIEKSFAFPQAVFERIRDERVTGFPLVPTMVALTMQARDLDPSLFSSLRYVTCAAAPLPLAHLDWLRAFLPGVRIFCMYGQTECTRATWLPPDEMDRRRGSVGIAIPGTTTEVVDEAGLVMPAGAVGELVVSGPHVMQGYWRDEAATRRALRSDPLTGRTRLHTGDLFIADVDGFLTFVARKDDIIKSRGEKVAPRAVEDVLHQLPGVAEALVIGVPDPLLGQAVKAIVVTSDPALSARDVMRHCAQFLEDHMVPRAVEFRDTLPKTDSGKASRHLARDDMRPNE